MKKGFTLVELLAVIVILGILMLIAVPAFNKYVLKSEDQYYKDLEKIFQSAVMDYASDHKAILPKLAGNVNVIEGEDLEYLVANDYMSELVDTKGMACESAKLVIIRKGKNEYEYVPCLKCGSYQSADVAQCSLTEENNRKAHDITVQWEYVGSGTKPESFPEKNTGYQVTSVTCDNAEASWNDYEWRLRVDYSGYSTTCKVVLDDGDNNPKTQEIENLQDQTAICQNETEDDEEGKNFIVNGINSAVPAKTDRVTTSYSFSELATFIQDKMYKYRKVWSGSHGVPLSGTSSGSNRSASGTIYYGTTFSYTPTIKYTINGTQHAQCSGSISNIKTDRFDWYMANSGSGTGNCTINWQAY